MSDTAKQTMQDAAETLGSRMHERKADMKFDARLRAIERNISQVDNRIEALGKRFPRNRGSRFPFGLALIAGLGYALYNPSTRSKVLELIGNVSPQARDAVEGVMGRANSAVDEVKGGRSPGDAVKDAAQGIGQEVRDIKQDLGNNAPKAGDRLANQAANAVDTAANKGAAMANDAQRGVDRLADKAQDKLNDIKH